MATGGNTYSGASLAPYVISGILRDFTPDLNPDFAPQPNAVDRDFVANLIDTDALPGVQTALTRACGTFLCFFRAYHLHVY